MEVVYHLFKTTGGPVINIKVQVVRKDPIEVPSLISIYPGADFQEREIWDLYGIVFTGHPDLRRILMWEGFAGHPMRKDWKEAYFEDENKPYKSRWPKGRITQAEDQNTFSDNIAYPEGFDPEKWVPEGEDALYGALAKYEYTNQDGIKSDNIVVNLGPNIHRPMEFFVYSSVRWRGDRSTKTCHGLSPSEP